MVAQLLNTSLRSVQAVRRKQSSTGVAIAGYIKIISCLQLQYSVLEASSCHRLHNNWYGVADCRPHFAMQYLNDIADYASAYTV